MTKDNKLDESSVKQAKNKREGVSLKEIGNSNFDDRGKFAEGNKIGNRFEAGVSGNPNGRPRKFRIKEMLGEMVDEKVRVKGSSDTVTVLEAILRKIVAKAITGDKWAISFIADRTEGKPIQPIIEDEESIIQFLWESETGEPTEGSDDHSDND